MVNYLLKDHHRRVGVIAYHLAKEMGLTKEETRKLVVAASLHDIGALYVKERDQLIEIDTLNPVEHAVRGSFLLKKMDFFESISEVILHHHRNWGNGLGATFKMEKVPTEAFVLHLADRIEILLDKDNYYITQVPYIVDEISKRTGKVFHPQAAKAFDNLSKHESFWLDIESMPMDKLLKQVLDDIPSVQVSYSVLEHIAEIFSAFVDFKSKFTATHSSGVGMVAYALGKSCRLSEEVCKKLKLAGYLHDIGKLGIPTELIDKDTLLSSYERNIMKSHAYYTNIILSSISGMEDICKWASMHHEKRDGSGYPNHVKGEKFSIEVEILALADIFTALSEDRPYRIGMDADQVIKTIEEKFSENFSEPLVRILKRNAHILNDVRYSAQKAAMTAYSQSMQSVYKIMMMKEMIV
jgi:HD-GYP domain-containing protein (c-di-GMP phosphodiesterase class II)